MDMQRLVAWTEKREFERRLPGIGKERKTELCQWTIRMQRGEFSPQNQKGLWTVVRKSLCLSPYHRQHSKAVHAYYDDACSLHDMYPAKARAAKCANPKTAREQENERKNLMLAKFWIFKTTRFTCLRVYILSGLLLHAAA
jgi:hypothetical protein